MKIVFTFNLQRLWKWHKEGKFGIISAYRNEYSKKENESRSDKLKQKVRDLGYGYKEIQGVWKGDEGITFEYPLFIPNLKPNDAKALGKEFEQQAVIFSESPDKITLWDTHKDELIATFTKIELDNGKDAWESYSTLKGKKFRYSSVEWNMPVIDPTIAESARWMLAMAEENYFKRSYCDFPEKEKSEIVKKTSYKLISGN